METERCMYSVYKSRVACLSLARWLIQFFAVVFVVICPLLNCCCWIQATNCSLNLSQVRPNQIMLRSSRIGAGNDAALREMYDLIHRARNSKVPIEDVISSKSGRSFGVDINTKVYSRNYSLNCSKAIKKKLEAANRGSIYDMTVNLDGIYFACQAGLYELVRMATHVYYTQHKTGYNVVIDVSKDKSMNVVQVVYRVRKCVGTAAYTLTLYHTKSALYVNGRGARTFADKDWVNILDLIFKSAEVHPSLLNDQLRDQLVAVDIALKTECEKSKIAEVSGKARSSSRQKTSDTDTGDSVRKEVSARTELSRNAKFVPDLPIITESDPTSPIPLPWKDIQLGSRDCMQASDVQGQQHSSLQNIPIKSQSHKPREEDVFLRSCQMQRQHKLGSMVDEQKETSVVEGLKIVPGIVTHPSSTAKAHDQLDADRIAEDNTESTYLINTGSGSNALLSTGQLGASNIMVPDMTVTDRSATLKSESRISGAQMFQNIMVKDGETHDNINCTEESTNHAEKFTDSNLPATQWTTSSMSSRPTSPKGATADRRTSDIFATSPSSPQSYTAPFIDDEEMMGKSAETNGGKQRIIDQGDLEKMIKEIEQKEKDLKERERKAKHMEKMSNQRTKDVEKKLAQHESTRRYAQGLEARVKDLSDVNELLQKTTELYTAQAAVPPGVKSTLPERKDGVSSGVCGAHVCQDHTRPQGTHSCGTQCYSCHGVHKGCEIMTGPDGSSVGYNRYTEAKMEAMEAKILLAVKESENKMIQMMVNLNLQFFQQQTNALTIHSNLNLQQVLAGSYINASRSAGNEGHSTLQNQKTSFYDPLPTTSSVKQRNKSFERTSRKDFNMNQTGNQAFVDNRRPVLGNGQQKNRNTWAGWNPRKRSVGEQTRRQDSSPSKKWRMNDNEEVFTCASQGNFVSGEQPSRNDVNPPKKWRLNDNEEVFTSTSKGSNVSGQQPSRQDSSTSKKWKKMDNEEILTSTSERSNIPVEQPWRHQVSGEHPWRHVSNPTKIWGMNDRVNEGFTTTSERSISGEQTQRCESNSSEKWRMNEKVFSSTSGRSDVSDATQQTKRTTENEDNLESHASEGFGRSYSGFNNLTNPHVNLLECKSHHEERKDSPILDKSYSVKYKRWPHDREREFRCQDFGLLASKTSGGVGSLQDSSDDDRLHIDEKLQSTQQQDLRDEDRLHIREKLLPTQHDDLLNASKIHQSTQHLNEVPSARQGWDAVDPPQAR